MLKRSSLLYTSFLLTAVIAALHFLAIAFHLYWTYWWFDWMMHFLAGLAGGLATYWVLFDSGLWWKLPQTILVPALSVFVCLMLVGVAWEIMEYIYGLTYAHEKFYLDDVINDLLMDASGAILAVLIGVRHTYLRGG